MVVVLMRLHFFCAVLLTDFLRSVKDYPRSRSKLVRAELTGVCFWVMLTLLASKVGCFKTPVLGRPGEVFRLILPICRNCLYYVIVRGLDSN